MDLEIRKYHLIQELFGVDKESVIDALERVLKNEKETQDIPTSHRKELDSRLNSYKENPNDLLDWNDVKNNW